MVKSYLWQYFHFGYGVHCENVVKLYNYDLYTSKSLFLKNSDLILYSINSVLLANCLREFHDSHIALI